MIYVTRDDCLGGAVKVWYGRPQRCAGRWVCNSDRCILLRTFGLEETMFPAPAQRARLLRNYRLEPGQIIKLREEEHAKAVAEWNN